LFGGRSGARQIVAASVVDRLVFVPAVLVPLALAGVFPHLLVTFAILEPVARHWCLGASRSQDRLTRSAESAAEPTAAAAVEFPKPPKEHRAELVGHVGEPRRVGVGVEKVRCAYFITSSRERLGSA